MRILENITIPKLSCPDYGPSQLSPTSFVRTTNTAMLRDITPPIDEEEENEEIRRLGAEARKTLENEGCPPCYPPELEPPFENIPEKYQAIIRYWQSHSYSCPDAAVLCAQLTDWQKFRRVQMNCRAQHRRKPFADFVAEARERRLKHGLDGDVHLLLDPKKQNRFENWLEFQNFNLIRLEELENQRKMLENKLADSVKHSKDARPPLPTERLERIISSVEDQIEYVERDLMKQKIYLHWIEQQRLVMINEYSKPVEQRRDGDAVPNTVRNASPRKCSATKESFPILGNAKISKSSSKQRNTRYLTPITPDSTRRHPETIPQCNISPAPKLPKRRATRRRQAKPKGGALSRQLRPRKQSKAGSLADVNTKSLSQTISRDAGRDRSQGLKQTRRRLTAERSVPARSQPSAEGVTTRSGRISRPPTRWAPY